jgi:hypothetical protein
MCVCIYIYIYTQRERERERERERVRVYIYSNIWYIYNTKLGLVLYNMHMHIVQYAN